jgi:protein phosphatase methylesterase 1
MSWLQLPDIILIGHSLGGAVATEVANKRLLGQSVLGYGVLDVVEGRSYRPSDYPSQTPE